jgi:preprotein translocase subunit SecD
MRAYGVRASVPAALLPVLCMLVTVSCVMPGTFATRDTGVYMIIAVRAEAAALEAAVRNASQVIETRCSYLGVSCKIERQGDVGSGRLKLSVSGARDIARVKSVLLAEGKLEMRPVVSSASPKPLETYPTREAAAKAAGERHDVAPYEEAASPGKGNPGGAYLVVEREPVVTGLDLRTAEAASTTGDGATGYQINFTLRPEGATRFGTWTEANSGRYLAVMLNGRVRSAPYIKGRITDTGQINGDFSREQAEDVALTLRSGNMPAPIEVLEEGSY